MSTNDGTLSIKFGKPGFTHSVNSAVNSKSATESGYIILKKGGSVETCCLDTLINVRDMQGNHSNEINCQAVADGNPEGNEKAMA